MNPSSDAVVFMLYHIPRRVVKWVMGTTNPLELESYCNRTAWCMVIVSNNLIVGREGYEGDEGARLPTDIFAPKCLRKLSALIFSLSKSLSRDAFDAY